ncbi:uncharacterized protein [Palaemon carinicauda]|uniref:uncharacterized protein n=1 Tax=Palaemon carinicauda TaxID=392227 RepID=UPI0035B62B90
MIKYEENEKQREENEKQRAHELELQKIRGATSNPSHVTVAVDTTRPLPFCDTDDITAYLVRFEKVAVSLNWERNSWSVQLASLLRGKALDIYMSLSDDVTSDYASLKEALLKGFKKTSDWYRTAFKTAKMDSKSTYEQYLNILFRNFDLWINSLRITKDYEDLRNIIVCDQFMSTLPKERRLFLKERKPRTPEDYSSLADTYASAHKCYPKDEQKSFRHNANLSSSSDKISESEKPEKTSSSRPGKIACYGCGQSGHISRNCPNKVPKKKSESSLEIGQVLDNTGVCGPMVCGTVNGVTLSTILRDTGFTTVVVSEDLIPDPGTNCSYSTLIDYLGRKDRFPIVKIYLKYVNAVTRAQVKRRNIVHPLSLLEPFDISIDHESFLREQQNREALKYAREMNKPGKTSLQEHNIKIKTTEPFVRKYYPIPAHLTKDFDDEVQSFLDLGIIEQSSSNYSSPALLVKKKEGNYRLVVDFRTLNAITDFDCEPMPSFEQDLHKFADFMYITKLDISKAYHQIPLTPESRKYTAFSTNLGLMQYDKIGAILDMPAPTTKKQLRSFIGSVNFYGRFIPNLSDKLIHLTKFLKKGSSEKFNFDDDALCKFNELKSCLTSPPILQVPDLNNIFCFRTDASSTGLGAVLLQYIDGEPYPVAFASKKLLPRETRYAAIERECLAIV